MKRLLNYDVLIIGGGVIGLSIAIALQESQENLKIVIAEKEEKVILHASGRNSGVIHAGFYYSPESLKAQFCRDGNHDLRKLCIRNSIPILETGKVVKEAKASDLLNDPDVRAAYLGTGAGAH